jgi:ABC-type branched-subunit amino acid transport system substrate-binding protein
MSWHTLVDAFRYAAAPTGGERGRPDRKAKARVLLSPVVVRAAGDARQAVETLSGVLNDGGGRCVAHVHVAVRPGAASPHDAVTSLGDVITPMELRRGVVEHTGRLRLPNYSLMCDIVEWLRRSPDPERPLRDFCFERKRERRPFLGGLWRLGGAPADGFALAGVWNMLGGPFFQLAPRWQWTRGLTRHLLRSNRQRHGWYRSAAGEGAPVFGVDFFEHVEPHVKGLLEGGNAHHGSLAERQRELDRLLVHALLADLARWARPTRIAPWRRRRVTRFVFLMHLPDEGDEGKAPGNRWEHFFEVCGSAVQATRCGAALWAAVGPRDAALAGVDVTLVDAADMLRSGHGDSHEDVRPLRVSLPARVDHPRTRPARRSIRPTPGPRLWASVESLGAAAILLLSAWGGETHWPDAEPDPACLGGSSPDRVAASLRDPADTDLLGLYREAREMIEEENARADEAAAQGRTVRTIAYMAVPVSGDWDEDQQRSDGAVPELRGIALAQRELNDEARSDDQKVWLRVQPFDAGEGYRDAPDAAREIVARAEADPDELLGVVGIAQSWDTTREAVQVLSAAQIPTIATNATADEMQSGVYFHQIAPPSSREAEIASAFARQANIVQDASGGCAPAEAAVVVQDPNDLYSMSLGTSFSREFADGGGDSVQRLWHSPEPGSPRPTPPEGVSWEESIHSVAVSVCQQIRRAPDTHTVVYWAARSREFDAFLNDFKDSTPCAGDPLTVVGGNGLTNPALSGMYENPSWLRLYHAVHVLPVGQSLSHIAEDFNAAYAREFESDDPWRNDGHAALAYDTMQVMAEAANEAYGSTGGQSVDRASVQVVLNRGVKKAGASGAIQFASGEPVSRDKPLVILYHADGGSEPVLSCGEFAPNAGSVREWGPEDAYACPRDS